eukprot:CAMPEP_0197934078 /NCGR_PEP_ID=MMETSP1439-20131203/111177_1 /TAXON_ID=66791 /ORGANISM="Gonyaulax spinifera, Strain CCMP409" /LENGTH=93 /DNA_ID=CAMNT_0043556953 /DNA_START=65 /DNA_END=342 /DNA_ORIENTATION=-
MLLRKKKVGKDINSPRLDYLAQKVKSGSISFLREEYKFLSLYVVFWFIVIIIVFSLKRTVETDYTDGIRCAANLLVGAFLSGSAGWFGMTVAT